MFDISDPAKQQHPHILVMAAEKCKKILCMSEKKPEKYQKKPNLQPTAKEGRKKIPPETIFKDKTMNSAIKRNVSYCSSTVYWL